MNFLLSNYSPGLVSHSSLEAVLIHRGELITNLTNKLQKNVLSDSVSHILLVGPPGIGKTFTISLMLARLTETQTAKELVTVRLNEEAWGITSYFDLLHQIFSALPNHSEERLSQISHLQKIEQSMAELALEEALEELMSEQKVLLVAESIDEIFFELGKKGQKKFRAFLQNSRNISLLCSSRDVFSGISSYAAAFYGFFEIVHLQPFSFEESLQFLTKLAVLNKNKEVENVLSTPKGIARAKAIHHLAGGNPRIFMLFYSVLAADSIESLINPVIKVLDDLTPACLARMMELSPQQRKIVDALASSSTAKTVKAIADDLFISQQSVSSQLRDLKIKQVVQSVSSGRESYYDIKEPLFKLCIQLKSNNIGFVNGLLDFLEAWYSPNELQQRIRVLHARENLLFAQLIDQYQKLETVSSSKQATYVGRLEKPLNNRISAKLQKHADSVVDLRNLLTNISNKNYEEALKIIEKLLSTNPTSSLLRAKGVLQIQLGQLAEGAKTIRSVNISEPEHAPVSVLLGLAHCSLGQYEEALSVFEHAKSLGQNHIEILLGISYAQLQLGQYGDAIDSIADVLKREPQNTRALLIKAEGLLAQSNFSDALAIIETAKTVSDEKDLVDILLLQSQAYYLINETAKSLANLEELLKLPLRDDQRVVVLGRIGSIYQETNPLKAMRCFRQAIAIKPTFSNWMWLAELLIKNSKFSGALLCLEKALELDEHNCDALTNKAICLASTGKPAEAMVLFNQLRKKGQNADLTKNIVTTLLQLGEYESAVCEFETLAATEFDGDPGLCYRRAYCYFQIDQLEQSASWLNKAISEGFTSEEEITFLRAALAIETGKPAEAIRLLQSLERLDQQTFALLVEAFQERGDLAQALDLFSQNHSLYENSGFLWLMKGILENSLEQYNEALSSFLTAYRLEPDNELALFLAIMGLVGENQYSESVKYIIEAAKLGKEKREELSLFLFEEATEFEEREEALRYLGFMELLEEHNVPKQFFIAAKAETLLTVGNIEKAISLFSPELSNLPSIQAHRLIQKTLAISLSDKNVLSLEHLFSAISKSAMLPVLGAACLRFVIAQIELGVELPVVRVLVQVIVQLADPFKEELERPLALCRTVIEFAESRDSKLLAQIPIEERTILEDWLRNQKQPPVPEGF